MFRERVEIQNRTMRHYALKWTDTAIDCYKRGCVCGYGTRHNG